MKKIPKLVLKYFSVEWTKENRKLILKSFKKSVNKKITFYSSDFVKEKIFEKDIKVYDRDNSFFQEFSKIEIGSYWYDTLSFGTIFYLKEFCKKLEKQEKVKIPTTYTPSQVSSIDSQMFRLQEYFFNNPIYHCFLRKDMTLRTSSIERFVINRKPLYSPMVLLERVRIYAIENNLPFFNEKGNLLPIVIKSYLNGDMKLPMTLYDKIKKSVKRTEIEFENLANSNLKDFDYFVTLTFADIKEKDKHLEKNSKSVEYGEYDLKFLYVNDPTDYEMCIEKMNSFFTNLKREYKKVNFDLKYLGVPEYQKNGNIHYHFLMNEVPEDLLYDVPSWLDYDNKVKARRFDKGFKKWLYGKSTVERIEDKMRIVEYISKYLTKSLDEIKETAYLERLNKRRYYYSRNLEKPVNEYIKSEYETNEEQEETFVLYEKTNLNFYNQNRVRMVALKKFESV